ncbi:unnamed protein product [Alopecurus aequalis]
MQRGERRAGGAVAAGAAETGVRGGRARAAGREAAVGELGHLPELGAETQDSNGDPVRISFDLQAPPGPSRLCLHCPEERETSCWDLVVASHRDAVLFRLEVDFDGLWVNNDHAMDYFIYRASSSSLAKLTLLPRCFSTEAEAYAADASSWRRGWRMVHSSSIGLLANGEEHFLVAELTIEGAPDSSAPLVAKLFRLNSADGQWELTQAKSQRRIRGGERWPGHPHASAPLNFFYGVSLLRSMSCPAPLCSNPGSAPAKSRGRSVTFMDVLGWKTHRVIPFSTYLCWADYNRGVLFCDVRHQNPELQYLRLPAVDDDMPPREDYPEESCSVCVTDGGNTMMFVKVVKNSTTSICRNCNPGSGFNISVWRMHVIDSSTMQWVENVVITDNELWDMVDCYHPGRLPRRSVPQFPVVSMDDPDILYFVLRVTPVPADEATACLVTLDIKGKKVLRCDGIRAFLSDDNFCSGFGFFPSNFTNYLMKHTQG